MTHRRCLPVCRPLALLLAAFFSIGLFACRTASDLSLEEARNISAAGGQTFTPPPRTGVSPDLAHPDYLDGYEKKTCWDASPKSVDMDRVIRDAKQSCQSRKYWAEKQYCLADMLFERGRNAMNTGRYSEAITLIKKALAEDKGKGAERYRPHLAASYAAIGDFKAARWNMGGGDSSLYRSQSGQYQVKVNYYVGRASLAKIRGDYREAENFYRKARDYCVKGGEVTQLYSLFNTIEHQLLPDLGEVLLMQGRFVEAELVLRESMGRRYYRAGGFTAQLRSMVVLGRVFFEQARYTDAEVMFKATIGVYRRYGFKCFQLDLNIALHGLARTQLADGRPAAALEQFEAIRHNMRHTPRIFEIRFANDPDWAFALLADGQFARAESMLAAAHANALKQYGGGHHLAAEIQGLLAVAQSRLGRPAVAGKNFTAALPVLLRYNRSTAIQTGARAAFNRRLAWIVEAYMAFIHENSDNAAAARKTFPLADTIRGQAVQQAVVASSLRIASKDRRLADLVRREQDAGKKITALNAVLLNARSQSDGGGERAVQLAGDIGKLQQARTVIIDEIEKKFPTYAELTRPRPRELAEIKAALRPDEALLAFYIGRENAFVWSIPGRGEARFAVLPLKSDEIEKRVRSVRQSLAPKGPGLSDLPRFALVDAQKLYLGLLAPVAAAWQDARHLIIVPHGPLGHLPFGLLVPTNRIPKSLPGVPLAHYRRIPWLIRDYSFTVLPSSGSLLTLRQLPEPDPNRRTYAGFGDPVFSAEQVRIAADGRPSREAAAIATRAIRITSDASLDENRLTSATLEMLQPLPDTRKEVLAIATALGADVEQDVFLGKAANESALKQLDLSDRRVLVFATHGLVPGDLDGLRQPALALSSPQVTGDPENDGLLTMGEIMGLRLNADWVVLSACNTAAGQGAGSEAVSGLGQAFFYAGTRALLVSSWPVESVSARMLTTALFKLQEADPILSRAEALQRSMLKLLDEGTSIDPHTGKEVYAYAHPMFWAPFTLVGDGRK